MKFKVKLLNKAAVAEGTMGFYFEKPPGFEFKAGQNGDWELIDPPETDKEGMKRTFSFASSPNDPGLGFVTRMRDTAFKRVLKNMPLGSEVELEGPFGDMTLHGDVSKPAVFLAGGIGITPFMSMSRYAFQSKLPLKVFLFYSNRRPEDAPFLKELGDLEKENPNFKFIPTMTNMENYKQDWSGEKGYITGGMIEKYVQDSKNAVYYLAGPPQMVAAMRKILEEMGILNDYIRTEEFTGY